MNRREAKALVFKGLLIMLDDQNPWLDVGDDRDKERIHAAFEEVIAEFERRAENAPLVAIGGVVP